MRDNFRTVSQELLNLHDHLRKEWPSLVRIAIALYDEKSDLLHTFVKSSPLLESLNHYSITMSSVPSLKEMSQNATSRIIENLETFGNPESPHTKAILEAGFKSSYTVPLYMNGKFIGFAFFDATETAYFNDKLERHLNDYSRLIESLLISELLPIKSLIGMVHTTKEITKFRDEETGEHLTRMAYYVELIALELSELFDISDEEIEYMWLYAPLHDIGKIAIPDGILMKPAKLTPEEYEVIKTHVDEGVRMIDIIVKNFDFQQLHHLDLLYGVVSEHHERYDGSGYPKGLQADEISLIGRIIAVADVFDALTSYRVYRDAIDPHEVFEYLKKHSGSLFDPICVDAFINSKERVLEIYSNFQENRSY